MTWIVRIQCGSGMVDYARCPTREDADKIAEAQRLRGATVQIIKCERVYNVHS